MGNTVHIVSCGHVPQSSVFKQTLFVDMRFCAEMFFFETHAQWSALPILELHALML